MTDVEIKLRAMLATVATERGYQHSLTVTPLPGNGANYTSAIFRAILASPSKQNLKLFAKVALVSENLRKELPLSRLYFVESYFYNKLSLIYQKIQDKHDVLAEHRLTVPKCYAFNEEYLSETVVLEDLSAKGFTTHDRLISVDWEYAARAVDEMAKLHALSFAYAQKYPEEFKQAVKVLAYDIVGFKNRGELRDQMLINALTAVNVEHKDKVTEYLNEHMNPEKKNNYYKPLKYPVLIHGDYRTSNLMHKINESGELEVVILDYQTVQAGCAAKDLLYFIFISTDADFRSRYYHLLVDHYYRRLGEAMQRLQLDPEAVYSRTEFDLEMQEMLPFGLYTAIYMLQIVTLDATKAPKLDQELRNFVVQASDLFVERLNEIIKDYVTWGIIV